MSAVVDFPVRPEARPYLDAFRPRPGEPEWLLRHRRRSLARFAELGFPSRRGEAWRYLDLRALNETPMLPAPAANPGGSAAERLADIALPEAGIASFSSTGISRPSFPRSAGCRRASGSVRWRRRSPSGPNWCELNSKPRPLTTPGPLPRSTRHSSPTALSLTSRRASTLDRPVEIVHLASGGGGSFHTRSLVRLGDGSRATLLESFAGAGSYWRNDVISLRLRRSGRAVAGGPGRGGGGGAAFGRASGDARPGCPVRGVRPDAGRPHGAARGDGIGRRRRDALRAPWRLPAVRPRGGEHRHHGRSCGTGRRDPRSLQGRGRRAGARRFPGPDHGSAGRAEDRRAHAEPQSAPGPARRDRHQARARNLCRRREVQPRCRGRRPRRGGALLSAWPAASRARRRGGC